MTEPYDYLDCPALYRFRPPDWRWKLSRGRWTHVTEPWCVRLLAYHQNPNESPIREALVTAQALFDGDPLRHAELEARILANQPAVEIARQTSLPVDVVELYEATFFDIRDRLPESMYIRFVVLGLHREVLLPTRDVGHLWRAYAYYYGPPAINSLVDGVDRALLIRLGVDAYFDPSSRLPYEMQACIAIDRLPPVLTPEQLNESLELQQLIESGVTVPEAPAAGRRPRLLGHEIVIGMAQSLPS